MTTPPDNFDRNPIEVIADEFIERMRLGEEPTIEEYTKLHPEIAEQIRELLPTVIAMEQLKVQKERSERSRFLRGPGSLTKLGDFLILGEVGRGGMGIVYEAEQQSLGRHVAVKVLPRQSLLDEHRLERFKREAQTAARLHHTNIVPIFGVGEQDGYHYYVMQFIRGLGIDRVVRELRGEPHPARPEVSGTVTSMSGLARQAASALCNERFPDQAQSTSINQEQASSTIRKAGISGEETPVADAATNTEAAPAPDLTAHRSVKFWRSVARVGRQVADALHYAHSQGTLHRDIKPANLLLDGYGVVWITDFGLAKAVEDSNITHTGDVVGTLQYMAPEQFCGDYDARSDIYCLGLTVYELLTLQPAYVGSNRSGLIQKVTQGTPTTPRKIDPSIPADLETIILKAISRDPSHRYQTSAEFSDDFQRFLDDRPILARRTNPAQQIWRWCKRNRSLATASAVAIVAILALTFVGWMSYASEANSRKEALAINRRISDNLALQRQVFEKIFQRLVGPDVFQSMIHLDSTEASEDNNDATEYLSVSIPVVSQKDAKLLQDVLEFYDLFAAQNKDHPELQFNSAVAYHHVGDIHLRLGQLSEAQTAYIKAIQQYQRQPSDHEKYVAGVRNQLGQVYANQHMIAAAQESYSLVIESLSQAEGTLRFEDHRWRYELARAHDFMGSLSTHAREAGRDGGRRPGRGRRGPPDRRGPEGRKRNPNPRRRETPLHPNAEDPARSNSTERAQHHQSAQRLLSTLMEDAPDKAEYQLAKARSCRNYARFLGRSRSNESQAKTQALLQEAIQLLETLVRDYPNLAHYQFELAETWISVRPSRSQNLESSTRQNWLQRVGRADKTLRSLHGKYPTVPSYAESLARVFYERHHINMQRQNSTAAISALMECIQLLEGLVKRWPNNTSYLRQLSERRMAYAGVLERGPNPSSAHLAEATKQLRASISEYELLKTGQNSPGRPNSLLRLVSRYRRLERILNQQGDTAGASAARQKLQALARKPKD
jgi:serine/threonine protein kinase